MINKRLSFIGQDDTSFPLPADWRSKLSASPKLGRKSEAELERTDGTESSRKPRELLGTVNRECFSLHCMVRRCNLKKSVG